MGTPLNARFPTYVTAASLLWGLNAIAFVFHAAMAFAVLGLSMPLDNWKTHGGVILPVYKTTIQFVVNVPDSEGASTDASTMIDFKPQYEQTAAGSINLTALTILFFALSATFHLLIAATTPWISTYYWWIDECRQPLRYGVLLPLPPPLLLTRVPRVPRSSQVDRVRLLRVGTRLTLLPP